ncbi:MAG: hypothetical protein V3T17_05615 [Pseudomonadales bacterium]
MCDQLSKTTDQPPTIDSVSTAPNYFSLGCLEFSFHLLRSQHPTLALAVQNLIAKARLNPINNSREKVLLIKLEVQLVSNIVSALSNIAELVANTNDRNKEEKVAIHQVLLDWLLYAQTFLNEMNALTISDEE